jgi:hypothetical protein
MIRKEEDKCGNKYIDKNKTDAKYKEVIIRRKG